MELITELLFENRRIVVLRRGRPLSFATSLADLAAANWIASSVTSDSEAEFYPLFERHGLPKPRIVAQADSALSGIALCASSDLLVILPQQWTEFLASTEVVQQIAVRESLPAAPLYWVRRARLPLTSAAEYPPRPVPQGGGGHARRLASSAVFG